MDGNWNGYIWIIKQKALQISRKWIFSKMCDCSNFMLPALSCRSYLIFLSLFVTLLAFLKETACWLIFMWTLKSDRLGLQRHPVAALWACTSSAWPPSLQWFIVSLRLLLCDVWFSTELRPNTERLRIDSYWSVMGGQREGAVENKGLADPF